MSYGTLQQLSEHSKKRYDALGIASARLGIPESLLSHAVFMNPAFRLPYHNSEHGMTVALNALSGANWYDFSAQEQASLTVAGLFHDFGYVHGESETNNIEKAISELKLISSRHVSLRESIDLDKTISYIRATEFPHSTDSGVSLQESVMMDADVLQGISLDRARFYRGLSAEKGVEINEDSTREWLSGGILRTKWASYLAADFLAKS